MRLASRKNKNAQMGVRIRPDVKLGLLAISDLARRTPTDQIAHLIEEACKANGIDPDTGKQIADKSAQGVAP